jgi:hypothetical protein
LDVSREIGAVDSQQLGDTLLLLEASKAVGFAVCHVGPKTEAGSGGCYAKFGAVRSGGAASRQFEQLLSACEHFDSGQRAERLVAGANMGRDEAYRIMVGRGFRADLQGVAMHKDNDPGYNRSGVYILDYWRRKAVFKRCLDRTSKTTDGAQALHDHRRLPNSDC